MRATVFILLVCIAQAFAIGTYSQNTRLDLKMNDVTIRQVLSAIEDKSEFFFMYEASKVNVEKTVTVNFTNQTIQKILDELFQNSGVTYKINNRQIALSSGVSDSDSQQQRSVSGKVTDSTGAPLPGVTVLVKGTTNGIITDLNGKYTIQKLTDNDVLVFSFVGFKAYEEKVAGKSTINITMQEEAIGLDEVIAVGYGVQKKKLNTGSTIQVKGDELSKMNTTSPLQALQGKTPGVNISSTSGQPGADMKVTIRGLGTIGNSQPLYIIDGVEGDIKTLNASDIESIDVLKDAASAAIYGSQAANGVVLITTKQGERQRASFF